jgi:cyclopropane fatty-acyl-phospholipid synthase-like methyltransferase
MDMDEKTTFPWTFDEFGHLGLDYADAEVVTGYDRRSRVDPARERELLGELGLSRDHTLLEFGSGTGVLALEAARLCRRVIAVDVSAPMLAHTRSRAEASGIRNIEYVHQGFLSYEHRGAPADFVVTKNALHHLPDFWKVQALARVAAVLRPGGVLYLQDLVYAFEPEDADEAIGVWIDRVAVAPGDGWSRAELEEHVREEYSTYSWLLEAMLEGVGFHIEDAWYSDLKVYAGYTCIRR